MSSGGFNVMEENVVGAGQEVHVPDDLVASHPEECSFHGLRMRGGCHCFWDWEDSAKCSERRMWAASAECLGGSCSNCTQGVCFDPPKEVTATQRPAVFIYDLPPGFNQLRPRIAMQRNTPYLLWKRLVSSAHYTTDASQADFFFVPISAMGPISHGVIPLAIRYVAQHWPFYNASGGKDHFVVPPWDFGASWVAGFPGLERVRFLSHWGLTERDKRYANTCTLCGPSYVPGKDFVIPDNLEARFARAPPSDAERTTLLYFAGGPTSDIRAQLLKAGEELMKSRKDVHIVTNDGGNLGHGMDTSRFCLAPPGAGFGTRATLAVARGCIPVLVGDNIAPVFDGYLDWSTFSLRLAERDIPQMMSIIDAVSAEDEARLRDAGAPLKRHFVWSEEDSEDAFETTMLYMLEFKDWDLPTAPR